MIYLIISAFDVTDSFLIGFEVSVSNFVSGLEFWLSIDFSFCSLVSSVLEKIPLDGALFALPFDLMIAGLIGTWIETGSFFTISEEQIMRVRYFNLDTWLIIAIF